MCLRLERLSIGFKMWHEQMVDGGGLRVDHGGHGMPGSVGQSGICAGTGLDADAVRFIARGSGRFSGSFG
jgi:hypothetical protein